MAEQSEYQQKFKQVFLDSNETRWANLDQWGNKDKLTLKTSSGKLVTRTIQFYQEYGQEVLMQITVKGERIMVSRDTILDDQV